MMGNNFSKAYKETITAFTTPPGQSGLAVIRISGPAASLVAAECFFPAAAHFKNAADMEGYTCGLGNWLNIDQVILTCFKKPHSYTGEDVMEISCHGGIAVKRAILESILARGVQLAGPGEFSKRAFLNGKMDLAQAEAVMDLIAAEAEAQAKVAMHYLQGKFSKEIREMAQAIYEVQAKVELMLEFPEHEETAGNRASLLKVISENKADLVQYRDSFKQGKILKEGLKVVLAGRPNAGKSTLLNCLSGHDRAIVTAIPGTTRDTISEMINIDGIAVELTDTAGLRLSDNEIEQEGIQRAKEVMQTADLILWLVSSPQLENQDWQEEVLEIKHLSEQHKVIVILGKADQREAAEEQALKAALGDQTYLTFSAITLEGLTEIKAAISQIYQEAGVKNSSALLVTNERHKECIVETLKYVTEAEKTLNLNMPLDLVATLLYAAQEQLALITGDNVSEALVDVIFSRFCVGK